MKLSKIILIDGSVSFMNSYVIPDSYSPYLEKDSFIEEKYEEIILNDKTLSIEEGAFCNLKSLKTIKLNKKLSNIAPSSFVSCPLLSYFDCSDNDTFSFKNGVLYNEKLKKALYCCNNKEEIKIKEGITDLGSFAFASALNVKRLILPKSIKNILDNNALYGLINLESFTIPKKINKFNKENLFHMTNLKTLICDNPSLFSVEDNVIYNKERTYLYKALGGCSSVVTLPKTLKGCSETPFKTSNAETVIIPKEIDISAKTKNSSLNTLLANGRKVEKVIFEDKNDAIYEGLFYPSCDLSKFTVQDVYNNMKSFTRCFYPKNLDSELKKELFINIVYTVLYNKEVDDDIRDKWVTYLKNRRKNNYNIMLSNKVVLSLYTKYKLLSLEDVKTLSAMVKIENIEQKAILLEYENQNFPIEEILKAKEKELVLDPYSIEALSKQFCYVVKDDNTIKITNYKGYDKEIVIPEKIGKRIVNEIGDRAFSVNGKFLSSEVLERRGEITSIIMSDNITKVGIKAFEGCKNIKNLRLSNNIEILNVELCSGCLKLEKVNIPSNCKIISPFAFYNCQSVKEIIFNEKIEILYNFAFRNCDSITKISLPRSLKKIEKNTFYNCRNLTEVIVLSKRLNNITSAFDLYTK